mgnify:CR=1 FL=1
MIDTLPRRRKKGPPPMSARLSMATREVLKRQGFADMHILRHWPEIVGRSLAELSAPEKLTFPRGRAPSDGRKRARPEGAILTQRRWNFSIWNRRLSSASTIITATARYSASNSFKARCL